MTRVARQGGSSMTTMPVVMAAVAMLSGGAVFVRAQSPQPQPQAEMPVVTPAEIQRMFEAVALVRAQEALALSDERYLPFLAKYKALQDVRRRTLQERNRLLRELNRLINAEKGTADEAQLKERLKALQDLDARSEGELHKAYEGIDSVLDVRQQARFRLFEERMERQKLDLLMKARQRPAQKRNK
jgi:hypothetical protein